MVDKTDSIRNHGLDALRFVCAFLVICIHVQFNGTIGKYFISLTRIAVPIFFMITGYFYQESVNKGRIHEQIIKVIKLCVYSNFFYFIFNCFIATKHNNIINYINNCFSVKSVIKFFIFNDTPIEGHLWYLGALLYVLVIISTIDKLKNREILYPFIPILLICDLIFGKYSLFILRYEFPFIIVRNWLFVGIPYFLIGDIIRKSDGHNKKVHTKNIYVCAIVFSITTLLERCILISLNLNATRDHYISTTFLAITMFLLFRQMQGKGLEKVADLGRKYSTIIYIIHPIFIKICNLVVVDNMPLIGHIYLMVSPIFIFVLSLLFAIEYRKFSFKFKVKNSERIFVNKT